MPTEREVEAAAGAFNRARVDADVWTAIRAALTAAERVRGEGSVLDREAVRQHVDDACLSSAPDAVDQAADAIMSSAKSEADVRRDERERLAKLAEDDDCEVVVPYGEQAGQGPLAEWLRSQG